MPKKTLSLRQKVAIVLKLLKGVKETEISRRYGISRPTLYRWQARALKAIREALKAE